MAQAKAARLMQSDMGADGSVVITALSTRPAADLSVVQVEEDVPNSVVMGSLLTWDEVNEAALRCCWLAHYWELAHRLGICSEIAGERASYWQSFSPPEHTYHTIIERMVSSVVPYSTPHQGECEPTTKAIGPTQAQGNSRGHSQVSSTDVVEMERGMRQLSDLGIYRSIASCIARHARGQRLGSRAFGGYEMEGSSRIGISEFVDPEDPSLPLNADESKAGEGEELSELEIQEIRFQRSWVAYLWARAAMAGVEPSVALLRTEVWAHSLTEAPRSQHLSDLDAAMQELSLLGVEQQIWQRRVVSRGSV